MALETTVKTEKTINELARKAIDSNIPADQINNYLDQNQIETESEQIMFLKYCSENDQPYFQVYMHKELKKYIKKTKQSADFLIWLAKTDMNLISYDVLIDIYGEDLDLFNFLHDEFSKDESIDSAQILGLLLGGMGKNNASQLFKNLLAKQYKHNLEILTINSIWVTSNYQKIPKTIISLIIEYVSLPDEQIKHSSINLLLRLADRDDFVQKQVLKIAMQGDDYKYMISETISFLVSYTNQNKSFTLQLFQECLKIKDHGKKENIITSFRYLVDYYPIEYLKVLMNWMDLSKSLNSSRRFYYQLREIGKKGDINEIEMLLVDWISANSFKPVLNNELPIFLSNIYARKPTELLILLKKIDRNQKNNIMFIVKTIREFLSDEEEINEKTFSEYRKFLLEIGDRSGIDTNIDNKSSINLKIIALAYNIQFSIKKIDKKVVLKNLKQYSNIEKFFSNNIDDMVKEPGHHLIRMLNKTIHNEKKIAMPEFKYIKATLTELDTCLGTIIEKKHHAVLKRVLSQTRGFNSGFIQAIMFTKLSKHYKVQLDPDIDSINQPDLLVTINDQDYLFEIYSPQESNDMRYKSGVQVLDSKYVPIKIIKKFTNQLAKFSIKNIPIIAVIDETDEFVSEYEKTPLTSTLVQSIYELVSKNDSNYWEFLSAIMHVSRRVDEDQLKLCGRIIPIAGSKNPIPSSIIRKLNMDLKLVDHEFKSIEFNGKTFQSYT